MRTSAIMIGLGFLLVAAQVAFSDGARPNIISLPISVVPVTLGFLALSIGVILGVARGNAQFRSGVLLISAATLLFVFGVLQAQFPSAAAPVVTLVLGATGMMLCVFGLLRGRQPLGDAKRPNSSPWHQF